MHATVTVRDQVSFRAQPGDFRFTLALPATRVSLRELIRARVFQEVQAIMVQRPSRHSALVQPGQLERKLNGPRKVITRHIDWEKQADIAVQAFQENQFLVLVDEMQVAELDEMIDIKPDTQVTFLRLTALVGG